MGGFLVRCSGVVAGVTGARLCGPTGDGAIGVMRGVLGMVGFGVWAWLRVGTGARQCAPTGCGAMG